MVDITWGKFKGKQGVIVEKEDKNVIVLLKTGEEIKVSADHIKRTNKKHFPFVVTCNLVKSENKFLFFAFCGREDLAKKKFDEINHYPEFYANVRIVEAIA